MINKTHLKAVELMIKDYCIMKDEVARSRELYGQQSLLTRRH